MRSTKATYEAFRERLQTSTDASSVRLRYTGAYDSYTGPAGLPGRDLVRHSGRRRLLTGLLSVARHVIAGTQTHRPDSIRLPMQILPVAHVVGPSSYHGHALFFGHNLNTAYVADSDHIFHVVGVS